VEGEIEEFCTIGRYMGPNINVGSYNLSCILGIVRIKPIRRPYVHQIRGWKIEKVRCGKLQHQVEKVIHRLYP
jgi:hypothetical protein